MKLTLIILAAIAVIVIAYYLLIRKSQKGSGAPVTHFCTTASGKPGRIAVNGQCKEIVAVNTPVYINPIN